MDDEQIWSVGLVIDDVEARRLSESSVAFYMLEAMEGHYLRFSSPPQVEGEEFENLRLEVAANSALAAEDRALGIVYRARRAAGLPDKVVPVSWVSLLGQTEDGESYLDQAEELCEEEKYSLAIVAVEIHLEAYVKVALERAIRRMAPSFEEVLLQHRNNLRLQHPAGRRTVERFLGVSATALPEWEAYQAHLGRRNAVTHTGKSFQEKEAMESLAAVRRMWLRLAEAAKRGEETAQRMTAQP
jgi:hypothetical protein